MKDILKRISNFLFAWPNIEEKKSEIFVRAPIIEQSKVEQVEQPKVVSVTIDKYDNIDIKTSPIEVVAEEPKKPAKKKSTKKKSTK